MEQIEGSLQEQLGMSTEETGVEECSGAAAERGVQIPLVPPCRLAVAVTAGARVVGKGGESIRAIRAASGATVRVFMDELPEAFKRRQENIVVASCGESSAVRTAVGGILDRVFDRSGIPNPSERVRERPYSADVVVPERACGPLVGPGGERVKALIEELGCSIDVVREPLQGIAHQRRVRVLSKERDRVERGVWRIQEILAEMLQAGTLTQEDFDFREAVPAEEEQERQRRAVQGGGEVACRLLLAPGEAAVVVGRMGYNVRRLRDIAHVTVDDAKSPPFAPMEAMCSVSRAPLGERFRVVRLILAELASSLILRRGDTALSEQPIGSRMVAIKILLPAERWGDVMPLLSPVDAATSSQSCLATESGAAVQVQELHEAGPGDPARLQQLSLQGEEDQVSAAVWRLHQALEPWEPLDVPPRVEAAAHDRAEGEVGLGGKEGGGKAGGKGLRKGGCAAQGDPIVPLRRPPPPDASTSIDAGRPHQQDAASECPAPLSRRDAHTPQEHSPSWAPQVEQHPSSLQQRADHLGARPPAAAPDHGSTHALEFERSTVERSNVPRLPRAQDPELSAPACQAAPSCGAQPSIGVHGDHMPNAFEQTLPCPGLQRQWNDSNQAMSHAGGPGQPAKGTPPSLFIQLPNEAVGARLADDASGIAHHAGVKLHSWPAGGYAGGPSVLEVVGPAHAIAMTTYLVQVHLWLDGIG